MHAHIYIYIYKRASMAWHCRFHRPSLIEALTSLADLRSTISGSATSRVPSTTTHS